MVVGGHKQLHKMIIEIPFKTPTINHLYGHRGYRMFLKKEAKELREEIIKLIPDHEFKSTDKLSVQVDIYEDWYTQQGEIKRKDIANREKFLIDSIFDGLKLDDKQIFEHKIKKIQSNTEKAIITIEVL